MTCDCSTNGSLGVEQCSAVGQQNELYITQDICRMVAGNNGIDMKSLAMRTILFKCGEIIIPILLVDLAS